MKGYKTIKTTMGHRIRVKMSPEEIAERETFHAVLVLFPFIFGALFMLIWVKAG